MDRTEKKEYNKNYYAKNKEKIRVGRRKYYLRQRKKILEKNQEWRKRNPEKIKWLAKEYYRKNREELLKRAKKWRMENKEKVRRYFVEYYRRNVEMWRDREIKWKKKLVEVLGNKCEKCGIEVTDKNLCIFDFHHRDSEEKERNREWRNKDFMEKIKASKIMLLCANCHRKEHYRRSD